jgi:hypothetical protein
MFSSMSGKRNLEVAKIELSCGCGVVKGGGGKQLWVRMMLLKVWRIQL